MSIITKRGDDGQTDLLYGERIAKVSLRVETIGVIDELNAAIGLARCHGSESLSTELDWVQAKLVGLMGELAVLPKDLERYEKSEMAKVTAEDVSELENRAQAIESAGVSFEGWARPGASGSPSSAFLDLSRTVSRRAERRVLELCAHTELPQVTLFLNRLSDYLWLLARREEGTRPSS